MNNKDFSHLVCRFEILKKKKIPLVLMGVKGHTMSTDVKLRKPCEMLVNTLKQDKQLAAHSNTCSFVANVERGLNVCSTSRVKSYKTTYTYSQACVCK